jgi:hypothetical protein
MHLLGRSREAGGAQLTPQSQRVLTAFREPCLQVGKVRIQDAGSERPSLGHREALGMGILAHRPDRQAHRPADREQLLTSGMAPPNTSQRKS